MAWFDTHCHLDFAPFAEGLATQLASFAKAGLEHCFVPAVAPHNWQAVLKLAEYPQLSVGLGYHPCFIPEDLFSQPLERALESLESELNDLAQLVKQERASLNAWGECGLDGRFAEQVDLQAQLFKRQISLAGQAKLPLVVHSVRLHDQVAQLLRQQQFSQGGVIHAFSGSYQQAARLVDLGFKIGIGGVITWPRAEKTRKAIKRLPLDALVLETDAPDMPLYQMSQAYNTPLNLPTVFASLAELREESELDLQQALLDNSYELFSLGSR